MKTPYFALAALILGALSCVVLGLGEFTARWLLDVRIGFQYAQNSTWLEYAHMWSEPLFLSLLDPLRIVVSALPVVAILLLHGWPRVQIAIVVMVLILLGADLHLVASFDGGSGNRCHTCDFLVLFHALAGVVTVLTAVLCQTCAIACYLGKEMLREMRSADDGAATA